MLIINNKNYVGRSISITNGKVIVDGVDVTPDDKSMKIDIKVEGNIDMLQVDAANSIVINGTVNSVRTSSGDVECGNVEGNVCTSSGDVECGEIKGSVSTSSGDVKCGDIGGSVNTMSGNIRNKK